MHADNEVVSGGQYVPPRTTTYRDKYGSIRGSSQSEGRITPVRYKKVWLCSECYILRLERDLKSEKKERRSQKIGCVRDIIIVGIVCFFAVQYFLNSSRLETPRLKNASLETADPSAETGDNKVSRVGDAELSSGALGSSDELSFDAPSGAAALSDGSRQRLPALQVDADNGQALATESVIDNKDDAFVMSVLSEKVATKLSRSERRKEFDWSIRVEGVKFRIAASAKTVSESLECRNLRFDIMEGALGTIQPEQLWCKSDPDIGWMKR